MLGFLTSLAGSRILLPLLLLVPPALVRRA
jgi:hypothetical protein